MSTLSWLLADYPGFGFSTQFGPANDTFNTVIGFSNYYGQVFRDNEIPVNLHLIYFDADGNETAAREVRVPHGGAVQVDAAAEGISSDGMIAVSAIPDADIVAINNGRVNLKSPITTGFYIKWESPQGGRDIMHEWAAMGTTPSGPATQHAGFIRAAEDIEHGFVLMNPIANKDAISNPRLVLRESGQSVSLSEITLDPIPSMGSRIVLLAKHFPDFNTRLNDGASLVVDVIAENLAPPLTIEWHPRGDFHIHHL